MSNKIVKFVYAAFFLFVFITLYAPGETMATRVIFYGKPRILSSQILSQPRYQKPCEKCHIRDHRGNCRRIITFNTDGVKC